MSFIHASDGTPLHYQRLGSGEPVVLIPGLGGDGRFWSGVAEQLCNAFDLIVVDHRGAGRSGRPGGLYSIEKIAADVLRVMDGEEVGSAHLIGHSTGGTIVQTVALDAPGRAKSLVISGSWDKPDARFRALFRARLELLERDAPEAYQALTHVLGYTPSWIETHEHDLERAVGGARDALSPLAVTAARVRMLLTFDRSAELHKIRHPTLVIGATDDALIPFYFAQRLAARIVRARLCTLEGGHFHPRTEPRSFGEAVKAFLQST